MNKRILICDDDARNNEAGNNPILNLVETKLRGKGFDVFWFDGLDKVHHVSVTDPDGLAAMILLRVNDDGHEGLIMDLRWWSPPFTKTNLFGLDILERIVPTLPKHLPIERVAVLTRFPVDPGVLERIKKLGIPNERIFSKWEINEKWSEFLDMFS